MAQAAIQLDQEKLSCSVCLDLLKDPVTIPCGHSYCMSCITNYWDEKKTNSCPQCRESFTPRPTLMKSTMLAELVEELKKAGIAAASPDHSYAGPADVACDFCTGRKMKAIKSCLVCMASYCELHLQPHFNVAPLKRHKLVEATLKLQENICPRHDEVMKIFCRTDRQCICYLCAMDEHKGHDTVSAAAERTERQTELEGKQEIVQQRLQDRKKDAKVLQEKFDAIGVFADIAVINNVEIFRDLICVIEKKSSEVEQMIRTQQKTDESQVKEQQEQMQQEITELIRKDTELEKLSSTEDHLHFLNSYLSLSQLSETTHSPSTQDSMQYYEKMTAVVSEASDKLKALLTDQWPEISLTGTEEDILLAPKDLVLKVEFPPKEESLAPQEKLAFAQPDLYDDGIVPLPQQDIVYKLPEQLQPSVRPEDKLKALQEHVGYKVPEQVQPSVRRKDIWEVLQDHVGYKVPEQVQPSVRRKDIWEVLQDHVVYKIPEQVQPSVRPEDKLKAPQENVVYSIWPERRTSKTHRKKELVKKNQTIFFPLPK